jgi:flagellar biosynthesis/type III secretory pathway protein FliH
MSGLLKSHQFEQQPEGKRLFARSPAEQPAAAHPTNEELLEERIAELEAELDRQLAEWPTRLEKACSKAAREALERRGSAEEKALDLLGAAIGAALAEWKERLAAWDGAAAGIARAALGQVFAPETTGGELVTAALARQLERIEASAILRVRVSPDDFADPAALEAAAAGTGALVEVDPALASGACLVDLKLGHLDCGLGAQWPRIDELLSRLERESLER